MVNIVLRSFILFFICQAAIAGEANNGGGLAEQNFSLAYLRLEKFIDRCVGIEACRLSPIENQILAKIKNSLNKERLNLDQLQFKSGKATSPNIFDFDGAIRTAKTGSEIGSEIFINLDLIYPKDFNGSTRALSVAEAVGILVHEFGHHHGVSNHRDLDLLGAKVGSHASEDIESVSLFNGRLLLTTINHYWAQFIGAPYNTNFFRFSIPTVAIGTSEYYVDVTEEMTSRLRCPSLEGKLAGYNLRNVRWKRGTGESGFDDIPVLMRACVIKDCQNDPSSIASKTETIEVEMRFYFDRTPDGTHSFMNYRKWSMKIKSVNDWLPCPHDI